MDPALCEYLDRMELNATARSDSIVVTQKTLSQQIAAQSGQLRDLIDWRPDLEARLSHLQGAVADLQRAQYIAPDCGTAAAPAAVSGEFHGPDGHGDQAKPGGFPAVNTVSPPGLPVTGMTALQFPLSTQASDANTLTNQLMSAMGATAPSMMFPTFTGENPNLWKTLAEQLMRVNSTNVLD
jgi:hypothetical protein